VHNRWLLSAGLAIGMATSLQAQGLRIDPGTVRSRAALRSADLPARPSRPVALRIPSDTTARPHRSRLASVGLGFAAGAAAGLVVAYIVDRTQRTGDGRLENYLAIPLALGTATFMTVFVALGD
jgi:hypothetical protein